MKRLLVALALLLLTGAGISNAPAKNVFIGTNGIASIMPSSCPFSTDNGCAAAAPAQAGSTAAAIFMGTSARNPGGMLNQLAATSTNYSTMSAPAATTNMPNLEYPVGEVVPVSSLGDPAIATLPSGCTYSATGNASGGPRVTCDFTTGFNGQTLQNLSFDSNGSHHCVALLIQGNTANVTAALKNLLVRNGTADCASDLNDLFQLRSTATGATITATNVSFDGNGLALPTNVWQTYTGSCSPSGHACNPNSAFIFTGQFTCDYCDIRNWWGRAMQYNGSALGTGSAGLIITHSLLQGCCMSDPTLHSEYMEYAGEGAVNSGGFVVTGNTIIISTGHNNTGLAGFPEQFGTGWMGIEDFENNFYISGFGGGAALSVSVDNTSSVTGDVFTAGVVTGTANPATGGLLGSGPIFTCNTTGSSLTFSIVYDPSISGAGTTSAGPGGGGFGGTGSKWYMDRNSSTITSFQDDGLGGGSYDGVAGNVLTVVDDTSMNMLTSVGGVTVGGNAVSTISGGGAGTGGTGRYTIAGSAAAVPSGSQSAVPFNHLRTYWDIPPGVTLPCSALTPSPNPFEHAITDRFGNGATQVTYSNNTADIGVNGPSPTATVWSLRENLPLNSFTGVISAGNLTVSGLTGTAILLNDGLFGSGVTAGSWILSGTTPNFVVTPTQTVGSSTMNTFQTFCFNPTVWGGNVDVSGIYSSTLMNEYQTAPTSGVVPANGC